MRATDWLAAAIWAVAKPISRAQVLAGKILACDGMAVGAYLLFVALTVVAVPTVPGQGSEQVLGV